MISRVARAIGSLKNVLRSTTQILDVQRAALDHQHALAITAVDGFFVRLGLPAERFRHCRFATKKRLLDLYEHDVVYDRTVEDGCVFVDIKHDIRLFVPFSGFDEYIGLCWDVFVQGYGIAVRKPFIFIDIGSNLLNASLLFAQHPLCTRVFSYKLIPSIHHLGLRNLAMNPRLQQKIDSHAFGLYNRTGDIDVTYYSSRSGASGISEKLQESEWLRTAMDVDFVDPERRQQLTVPVKEARNSLEALIDGHPDDDIVIKVDAENSEAEIIENLSPVLDRVYCISVELHSQLGARKVESMMSRSLYRMHRTADNVSVFYRQAKETSAAIWVNGLFALQFLAPAADATIGSSLIGQLACLPL